jgi:hypothetical protein
VRSLSLDNWTSKNIELLIQIGEIRGYSYLSRSTLTALSGNLRANEIWEEKLLRNNSMASDAADPGDLKSSPEIDCRSPALLGDSISIQGITKINSHSSREIREKFIHAKVWLLSPESFSSHGQYIDRLFIRSVMNVNEANESLYQVPVPTFHLVFIACLLGFDERRSC